MAGADGACGSPWLTTPYAPLWLLRWLLFRLEFGAGLIKLRGDACWRNLTCLHYHHETQPLPGPLSWFFHHLPGSVHRVEVAANHVAQLVVPFALFAPQPAASAAAGFIILTQLWIIASGNFAWLNWLTIVLAPPVIGGPAAGDVLGLPAPPDFELYRSGMWPWCWRPPPWWRCSATGRPATCSPATS